MRYDNEVSTKVFDLTALILILKNACLGKLKIRSVWSR